MVDSVFPIAVLLAVVVRAIVDYLVAPIRKRYPDADLWYLVYVSFGVGAVIGWLSGVNLFADIATLPLALGRILTAACIGGGANLLHDLATRRNEKPAVLEDKGVEINELKWQDDAPSLDDMARYYRMRADQEEASGPAPTLTTQSGTVLIE